MRKSWEQYFIEIAYLVASRSTCLRRSVGAVAVSEDNRILGTGYNGALSGALHCDVVGCLRKEMNIPSGQRQEICRAQHAEANICNFAARHGVALNGATIYVTTQPCTTCIKAMATSGIKKVIFDGDYPDPFACEIAREVGMELLKLGDVKSGKENHQPAKTE